MSYYDFSIPDSYYLDPKALATEEDDYFERLEEELEEIETRIRYLQSVDLDEYAEDFDEQVDAIEEEIDKLEERRDEIERELEY